eukprot:114884_1
MPLTYISCKEHQLSKSIQKMIYLFKPAITRKNNLQQKITNFTMDNIPCMNTHKDCLKWSMENECKLNPNYMQLNCAKSCNTCHKQTIEFKQKHCKNNWNSLTDCLQWVAEGECIANPSFMREQCARACNYCDYEVRCKPYKYHEPTHHLSDIPNPLMYDKIFYKLLSDKYLVWKYNISLLSFEPPIIELDNFLTENMINEFINENNFNYSRSADAGDLDENFVYKPVYSETRTSKNAWCQNECEELNSTNRILLQIEEVIGINRMHFEQIQVLKYEIGEHYNMHHDYIDIQYDMPCGPRIITFFIYLNDDDLEGGETAFPNIDIKVKPKAGKAIIWPNVYSNDVFKRDDLTEHAAMDVVAGTKYAMNVWIHLFDFMTAFKYGCTG